MDAALAAGPVRVYLILLSIHDRAVKRVLAVGMPVRQPVESFRVRLVVREQRIAGGLSVEVALPQAVVERKIFEVVTAGIVRENANRAFAGGALANCRRSVRRSGPRPRVPEP